MNILKEMTPMRMSSGTTCFSVSWSRMVMRPCTAKSVYDACSAYSTNPLTMSGFVRADAPLVPELLVAVRLRADERGDGRHAPVRRADGERVHLVREDRVGVGVDAARQHVLPRRVDDPAGPLRREVPAHLAHLPAADQQVGAGDVASGGQEPAPDQGIRRRVRHPYTTLERSGLEEMLRVYMRPLPRSIQRPPCGDAWGWYNAASHANHLVASV